MATNIEKQMSVIEKNFTFLATVGATAPLLVYLEQFGDNELISIDCNFKKHKLAIVARYSEALFATALGLLAAIPAVVAYNKFNSDARKYSNKLEDFSKRFLAII